jgi:hypothetical protein
MDFSSTSVPSTFEANQPDVLRITGNESDLFTINSFYASVSSGDTSPQAFELTTKMISLNSASYTAWFWRRKCIQCDVSWDRLEEELVFVDSWCDRNSKNYQVWYHRRWILELLHAIDPIKSLDLVEPELKDLENHIEKDSKHYNAWSHRLFIAKKYGLLSSTSEFDFTSRILERDLRNNSAWSYRRNALKYHPDVTEQEIDFVIQKIKLAPRNEAAWVYLRSIDGWFDDLRIHELVHELGQLPHPDSRTHLMNRNAVETLAILMSLRGDPRSADLLENLAREDTMRERSLLFKRSRLTNG